MTNSAWSHCLKTSTVHGDIAEKVLPCSHEFSNSEYSLPHPIVVLVVKMTSLKNIPYMELEVSLLIEQIRWRSLYKRRITRSIFTRYGFSLYGYIRSRYAWCRYVSLLSVRENEARVQNNLEIQVWRQQVLVGTPSDAAQTLSCQQKLNPDASCEYQLKIIVCTQLAITI